MEFIEGQSLAERIADGALPFAEMIGYAIEIAAGLGYAHRRGVEHRDLKPGNVLLTPNGVKVIDFGLGKLRQTSAAVRRRLAAMKTAPRPTIEPGPHPGTAGYLPPERLQGLPATIAAISSPSARCSTRWPRGGGRSTDATPADLVAAILTAEPPPLAGDEPGLADVDWVIRRCLRKPPDERWQSMADVEAVLKRIAYDELRPRRAIAVPALSRGAPISGRGIVRRSRGRRARALGAAARRRRNAAPGRCALPVPPPPGGGFTPTESSVQSPQLASLARWPLSGVRGDRRDGVSQIWLRPIDSTAWPDRSPERRTRPIRSGRRRAVSHRVFQPTAS